MPSFVSHLGTVIGHQMGPNLGKSQSHLRVLANAAVKSDVFAMVVADVAV